MMIRKIVLFLITLVPMLALAQGVRFGDGQPIWRAAVGSNALAGVGGATIAFCNAPANAVPCTNKATTYTSSTMGTSCSTSTQVVLAGTTTCVATTDAVGNWGVWVASGQYEYTITIGGVSYGPYPATIGAAAMDRGTSSSYLTTSDTGDWNIFLRRYDATPTLGTGNKLPFANPYGVGVIRAEVYGSSAYANDQLIAIAGFAQSGTVSANSNSSHGANEAVAGYFFARTDAGGTMGATGINSDAEWTIAPPHLMASIEADIANGYADQTTSDPLPSTGILIASGGSFKPVYGLRTQANNFPTNAWQIGALFQNWNQKGVVSKPTAGASGTIAFEAQYVGNAATSLGTQSNSGDISLMGNRWNGSAPVFDLWKLRTVPNAGGTATNFRLLNTSNVAVMDIDPGIGQFLVTSATTVALAKPVSFASGVYADGGGLKHKRVTTGSIATATRTSVTVTWVTAFADANYTPTCTVLDTATAATSQGLVLERLNAQSASAISATVYNPTVGSVTGILSCSAVHD